MVTTDGRDTRWVEHREARRRALVEDALRAIRRHGAGVGMDEIAAQAETSKTVIYRHFGDRAGLYAAVVASVHDFIHHDLAAALELTDPGDLSVLARDLADAYLGLVERDPEIYRFVLKAPEADPSGTIDAYGGLPELIGDHVSSGDRRPPGPQRPGPGLRAHLGPRPGRVHPGGRRPVDGHGAPRAQGGRPRPSRCLLHPRAGHRAGGRPATPGAVMTMTMDPSAQGT